MKKHLIADMTLENFKLNLKSCDSVIFPVGATEAYGLHLPLGSDWIVTYEVAKRIAEKTDCFVSPPVTYGYSEDLMCYPGTLTISTMTLISLYREVLESFQRQGLKKVIFLSGHIGNEGAIDQVAMEFKRDTDMEMVIVDWWRFVTNINEDLMESDFPEGHAAEAGTSVLMYLFPQLIDRAKMIKVDENEDPNGLTDVYRYVYFDKETETSVLGDPFKASEEKGRQMVKVAVEKISRYIKDL